MEKFSKLWKYKSQPYTGNELNKFSEDFFLFPLNNKSWVPRDKRFTPDNKSLACLRQEFIELHSEHLYVYRCGNHSNSFKNKDFAWCISLRWYNKTFRSKFCDKFIILRLLVLDFESNGTNGNKNN